MFFLHMTGESCPPTSLVFRCWGKKVLPVATFPPGFPEALPSEPLRSGSDCDLREPRIAHLLAPLPYCRHLTVRVRNRVENLSRFVGATQKSVAQSI